MPLVDSRGYQLTPNISGQLGRGLAIGNQFQNQQLNRQLLQNKLAQQQQEQGLLGQIFGQGTQPQVPVQGGPQPAQSQDAAIANLFSVNPALGDKVLKSIGVIDGRKKVEAAAFAFDLENTPLEQREAKINARAQALTSQGRDPKDTLELLQMPPDMQNETLKLVQIAALPNEKRLDLINGKTASIKEGVDKEGPGFFAITPTGAKRIPGAIPKDAGVSEVQSSSILDDGTVQIVRKDGTVEIKEPDDLGKELVRRGKERGVDLQQRRAQGRGLGKDAAELAGKAFEQTGKLRDNNNTLRQVIETVKNGAETGPFISKLPSLRAESVRLDNIRRRLGLDVIGSVTFGSLSEGEMELALDTALPTGLDGPELIKWAEDKIAAQEKLATYLEEQAIFLSKPGATPADWIKSMRDSAPKENKAPTTVRFNREGQRIE